MKKFVLLLAVILIITAIFPFSAFAHGHHSGGGTRISYTLCAVENCNTTYSHRHGNTWYSGHSIGDGHDYHVVCNIESCTHASTHDHDGVICFPHNQNDGHGYHSYGHRSGGRCR